MTPRGKTDLGTLFWLLLVAGVIYAGVIFLPVWADDFDVKEAVNAAYQSSGKESDEALRAKIDWMLRNTGTHKEDDGFGNITVLPGLALPEEAIQIERNDVTRTVSVRISYVREVQLKPLKKIVKWRFTEVKQGPVPQ